MTEAPHIGAFKIDAMDNLRQAHNEFAEAVRALTKLEVEQIKLDEERYQVESDKAHIKIRAANEQKNDTLRRQVAELEILESVFIKTFEAKERALAIKILEAKANLSIARERQHNATVFLASLP